MRQSDSKQIGKMVGWYSIIQKHSAVLYRCRLVDSFLEMTRPLGFFQLLSHVYW